MNDAPLTDAIRERIAGLPGPENLYTEEMFDEMTAHAAQMERERDAARAGSAPVVDVQQDDARILAQRLADAVQRFRNLATLKNSPIRNTDQYASLCDAWDAWRGFAGQQLSGASVGEVPDVPPKRHIRGCGEYQGNACDCGLEPKVGDQHG